MAFDPVPHKLRHKGNEMILEKTNAFAKVKSAEHGEYNIQAGKVYSGQSGRPLKAEEIPEWLWNIMKNMSPKVLEEIGMTEKIRERFDLDAKNKPKKPEKAKRAPRKPKVEAKEPEVAETPVG